MRPVWSAILVLGAVGACACGRLPGGRASPAVILVGVDGADPRILDGLVAEGRLPTFARLKREGAYGRLRSREPLLSPIVWTSIVTGRKGQDHGILDFVELTEDGRAIPITSSRRRVPALWNIAGEFGRRSGFIGWYASYPVEPVAGFEVSDRLAFHQVRSERASTGGTFPAGLGEELRRRFGEPVPDPAMTSARFLDPRARLTEDGARRLTQLARIHATTEFYRQVATYLQASRRPDLLGVYFEAIDTCEHLFMEDAPPRRPGVAEADFRAFSPTVERCYEYQDEVLAGLLKLAGPDTVTIVCSDHGFKSGIMRPRTGGRADTGLAPLWHLPNGVLFIHGRSVRPGAEITGATVLDVAPTVLRVLSLPLSRELPGRPLEEAFAAGALPRTPPPVDSYRWSPAPPVRPAAEPDDERLAELRALGYLGTVAGPPTHDGEGRTATSYLNEGWSLAADGELEAALRAYDTALRLDPRNVNARAFAARVHLQRHDLPAAKRLLDEAAALAAGDPYVRLLRASWALEERQWTLAGAELDMVSRVDDRLPMLHLLKARLADATGRPAAALEELETAAPLTDADGLLREILLQQADVAGRLGRAGEAEAALDRAAAVAPASRIAAARGELAMARGDAARAVALFRQALQTERKSSALERKLGQALGAARAYRESEAAFRRAIAKATSDEEREGGYGDLSLLFQGAGREAEARAVLESGVAALPRSAALWGMLGAAHGRAGDLGRAIEAYERSVALHPTPLACKTLAALLLEERHDRRRAVDLWKQSLALDSRQPEVRRFLHRYEGALTPPARPQ